MRVLKYRHWGKRLGAMIMVGILVLNALAFMHARALTRFAATGQHPLAPESMSPLHKMQAVITGVTIPKPQNYYSPRDLGLPFEVHTIPLAADTQLEAWYIPHPQARGIVALFHSYAASKESLLHPAQAFHDLGYATFLVDFRGSGGSSGTDTTLGVREAEDVAAAVQYIQHHWLQQPIVLFGVSMGSTAIMRAIALLGVQPAAVILESPFDRLIHTTRHRFAAMHLPTFPATELLLAWGSIQQGIDAFSHNPVEYAPSINCPSLLLYGAHDPRVTEAETQAIFKEVGGQKRLARIAEAGHELLLLSAPDQWKQEVATFLHTLHNS